MSAPKQILVVRKDLNMRKGKIAAQAAHASNKVLLDAMVRTETGTGVVLKLDLTPGTALHQWLEGKFTKICVSVMSEEELLAIYKEAEQSGLPCALIQDSGLTEFGGVPTYTCCAIGPSFPEDVDGITGGLPLL